MEPCNPPIPQSVHTTFANIAAACCLASGVYSVALYQIVKTSYWESSDPKWVPNCQNWSIATRVWRNTVLCHLLSTAAWSSGVGGPPYSSRTTGFPLALPTWACCLIHVEPQLSSYPHEEG